MVLTFGPWTWQNEANLSVVVAVPVVTYLVCLFLCLYWQCRCDTTFELSYVCLRQFVELRIMFGGRDISVVLVTRYGLDGPDIESRWGRDFLHPSRPVLGPTHPPIQWVPGFFFREWIGWGVALTTHFQSGAEVKERVEIYLYSPSGSSWPVLGWTLLYFTSLHFYRSRLVQSA